MNLLKYLKKHHYSHEEFAAKVGCSRQTIHNACTEGLSSAKFIDKIMKATRGQVTFKDLLKKG